MRIEIVTPAPPGSSHGNRITAVLIKQLAHYSSQFVNIALGLILSARCRLSTGEQATLFHSLTTNDRVGNHIGFRTDRKRYLTLTFQLVVCFRMFPVSHLRDIVAYSRALP